MTDKQIEAVIWLMLEYEDRAEKLNVEGFSALFDLRQEWNIEKAKKELLGGNDYENSNTND